MDPAPLTKPTMESPQYRIVRSGGGSLEVFPIRSSGAAASVREEAPTLSTTSTAAMSKHQTQPPQPIIKTYRVNYSVTEKQRFLKRSKRSIRWYVVARRREHHHGASGSMLVTRSARCRSRENGGYYFCHSDLDLSGGVSLSFLRERARNIFSGYSSTHMIRRSRHMHLINVCCWIADL